MAYKQQKNQVYNTVYDEEIQEYPEITSRLLKLLNNDYDFKKNQMPIAIKNTAMPILNNQFPIIYHKRTRAKALVR